MAVRILIAGSLAAAFAAGELSAQSPIDRGGALEIACEAAQGCGHLVYFTPPGEQPEPAPLTALPLFDPILIGAVQNFSPPTAFAIPAVPNFWGVHKYVPSFPRIITIETSEPPLLDPEVVPARFETTTEID